MSKNPRIQFGLAAILALGCGLGIAAVLHLAGSHEQSAAPQDVLAQQSPGHAHKTYVPNRVAGDDRVETEVTSARGVEITVKGDDGDAIVFFEPDSFTEKAELKIRAEIQEVSTFFGRAKEGLNLSDETIELSKTIAVKSLSGNSIALQRVRISLPFNDVATDDVLDQYELYAVFSYPLKEGGITTTSLEKHKIEYKPTGIVTFWTQGVPLEAAIVGIPK